MKIIKLTQLVSIFIICGSIIACSSNRSRSDHYSAEPIPASSSTTTIKNVPMPIKHSGAAVGAQAINPAIASQDKLDITVFKIPELSVSNIIVESSGIISLPYIGSLNVLGLSLQQAEDKIETLLRKDLQDPRVTIKRTERKLKLNNVTVEGAVQTPGVFPFPVKGSLSFLQAIALSQGITEMADTKSIIVFRDGKRYTVNIDSIRRGLVPDPILKADDRIVVLKSDRKIKEKKILEYLPAVLAPLSLIL
ncbi:MAG TPA: polysaccharide export protein [Leucothrix mucor]|nr:polysaccharide export protein [Leucothrix mucor]